MRKISSIIFALFVIIVCIVNNIYAQEAMTGDSPPEIVVTPADSLGLLEAEADNADILVSVKEADLLVARALPSGTAMQRQRRIDEIRDARAELALATARAHRAKEAYLEMYAQIFEDTDARVSAYVHRRKAGEAFKEAYALTKRHRPIVPVNGKLGRKF